MPQQLIYTSAPRLLQAGRSGFGTVAMSRGIPTEVVKAAENFSQFSRQPGMESARVVYSYRIVRCGDGVRHVLSCIRDAGADYSGRTNHLARHLIFDDREVATCASSGFTPAGVLLGTEWPNHDGYCGWIESAPQWASSDPEPTWQWWTHYSSSPECRFNLCTQPALRGAVFIYGKGLEKQTENEAKSVLCLFAESQFECPNRGWGVTFTTSYEPNDELSDFKWIGVPENSPLLTKLETSAGREWVTLDSPPAARPAPTPVAKLSGKQAGHDSRLAGSGGGGVYSGGQVLVSENKAAYPPPIRPRATESHAQVRNSLFSTRNIAIFLLSLVALVTAVFLLRSIFAPIEIQLEPHTLKTTYNGSSHSVQILKAPPGARILYAMMGTESWSPDPPVNAGTYKLKVEVPGWFGTREHPLNQGLTVDKQTPKITFLPEQLEVTYNEKEHAVLPSIHPPAANGEFRILYKDALGGKWTNSPPRNVGNYTVQVEIAEARNFFAFTNVATLKIKSAPNPVVPATDAQAPSGAPGVTVSATPPPVADGKSGSDRRIFLPQNKGTNWLSQIGGSFDPQKTKVQYRETPAKNATNLPSWQDATEMKAWGFLGNDLLVAKPNAYAGTPLNYQVSGDFGGRLEMLELAEGAGDYLRQIYLVDSFYLERVGKNTALVRLGPTRLFSPSLETLPKDAYFEVTFDVSKFESPKLEFRKSPSGWETQLPLEKLKLEQEQAVERLVTLQEAAKLSAEEGYYEKLKGWVLGAPKKDSHEAMGKLRSLKLDANKLGDKAEGTKVMKLLVSDMVRALEPFVPLPTTESPDKKSSRSDKSNDASNPEDNVHEKTANDLDLLVQEQQSPQAVFKTAKEWIEGRKRNLPRDEKSKSLREILTAMANQMGGSPPSMTTKVQNNGELAAASDDKARKTELYNFVSNLGVSKQPPSQMMGRLSFVYLDAGVPIRIPLDEKINLQPTGDD